MPETPPSLGGRDGGNFLTALLGLDTNAIPGKCKLMESEKPLAMKTYRILLRSLGAVFVDAENYSETETTIAFYRGGLVSAEYPRAMVKEVTEVTSHQGRGGHSSIA